MQDSSVFRALVEVSWSNVYRDVGGQMNWKLAMAKMMLAVVTLSGPVVAQKQAAPPPEKDHHSRYRLMDLATFGGPKSYLPGGLDITAAGFLNNRGRIAGWADTSGSDPFPDFCWDDDCFVGHAFVGGRNGKRDLGVLPGGTSSDASWIAHNGLISGDSQNGQVDPLIPGLPQVRAVLWRQGGMVNL